MSYTVNNLNKTKIIESMFLYKLSDTNIVP